MARIELANIVEEFTLDYELPGTDDRVVVTIKQATTDELIRISGLFAEQTQVWDDAHYGQVQLKRKFNAVELVRYRAYLTMVDCNLEDANGPLFKFVDGKYGRRIGMTQAEFNVVWGALPVELTAEIHTKIIKVNPTFDFNKGE